MTTFISELDKLLANDSRLLISSFGADAARVILLRSQEVLLQFIISPDGPNSILIEEFEPESPDPAFPGHVCLILRTILPQLDLTHVVGLYPIWWHEYLERFGFKWLSERVRMELTLRNHHLQEPKPIAGSVIKPLSASVELLGEVLSRSEDATMAKEQSVHFIQSLLTGKFGPVIPGASCEACTSNGHLIGACVFTEYRGGPLLGHIFVDKGVQQRGIGEAMLRYCLRGLSTGGYGKAMLSTDALNESARHLYNRLGFIPRDPHLAAAYLPKSAWGITQ